MAGADDFTCCRCGDTFTKGRPDGEAMAESRAEFGEHDPADLAVVCEDCYRKVIGMTDDERAFAHLQKVHPNDGNAVRAAAAVAYLAALKCERTEIVELIRNGCNDVSGEDDDWRAEITKLIQNRR